MPREIAVLDALVPSLLLVFVFSLLLQWAVDWVEEMAKVLVTVRGSSRAPKMARMSGFGKDLKSAAVKVKVMDAM